MHISPYEQDNAVVHGAVGKRAQAGVQVKVREQEGLSTRLRNTQVGKEKDLVTRMNYKVLQWENMVELTGSEPATSSFRTKRIQFLAIDSQWLCYCTPFIPFIFRLIIVPF